MKNYKALAHFQFPAEYAVLKLLFDQENIHYVFQNETLMSIFPFTPYSGGGILLKVHEADFEKAKGILDSLEKQSHLKKV